MNSTQFSEHHIHIMIGCADARDFSQVHIDAINYVIDKFKTKKIFSEFHTIRAAGTFITKDVENDIKRIIELCLKESQFEITDIKFFIHIVSHGHLTEESNTNHQAHIYDLNIVEGSPMNCGMLHATEVAIEIEKMILESNLSIKLNNKIELIDTEEELRLLLKEYYAYDGYLAGDWICSIDNLRAHPRRQRTLLKKLINNDPDLKRLNIAITSNINDYSIHNFIRTDGGIPLVPFWNEIQTYLETHAENERTKSDILIKQSEKQKPLAGLFCLSDPQLTARALAADYYLQYKNIPANNDYLPNTIFNLSSSSFDIPGTPFGPYVITGFYYSVVHLHLTDWMIVGKSLEETNRICKKLKSDVIMNLIIEKFNVQLIPLVQGELENQFHLGS